MHRQSFAASCAAALLLSGCASFPQLPGEPRVHITEIIGNVECEIANAINLYFPQLPWIVEWAASITLRLNTTTSGGVGGDIGLVSPLLPGFFELALTGSITKRNESIGSFTYLVYLDDLYLDELPNPEYTCPKTASVLTGYVGVQDWIRRSAEGVTETGNRPTEISYNVEFLIRPTGDVSPRFSLIPVGSSTVGGGVLLGAFRSDAHKLTVTLTEAKDNVTVGATEEWRRRRLLRGHPVDGARPREHRPVAEATEQELRRIETKNILGDIDVDLDRAIILP